MMAPADLFAAIADAARRTATPVRLPSANPPHRTSWPELCDAAVAADDWLRERGVGAGDVVAVVAEPDPAVLATVLAVWRRDAAVTVLATPQGAKRTTGDYPGWLAGRLADVGAKLLVARESAAPPGWAEQPGHEGVRAWRNPADPAPLAEPVAILQCTSGSTGDPKIVPVSAAAVRANVAATAERLALTDADSVVSWLPLNHDMGLIGTFLLPALTGLPLQLSTPDTFVRSPLGWLADLAKLRATVTFAPHFAYGLVARYATIRQPSADLDLSSVRHCLNGSEPINAAEFAEFAEFGAAHGLAATAPRAGYGMAEVGLVLTVVPADRAPRSVAADPAGLVEGGEVRPGPGTRIVSCGPPLSGYAVTVRTRDGVELPPGTVGELCVTGPSLFPGYLGRDRAGSFWPDGAYRTGDLGFVDDGEVFVCGRIKDVVIVRGENVLPQDIERRVAEVDGVRRGNVAAFGVRTGDGAEGVVVVAETDRRRLGSPELKARVSREVRDWFGLRPVDVVLLPQGRLPKTTSGKLQRLRCRQTYLTGAWS